MIVKSTKNLETVEAEGTMIEPSMVGTFFSRTLLQYFSNDDIISPLVVKGAGLLGSVVTRGTGVSLQDVFASVIFSAGD